LQEEPLKDGCSRGDNGCDRGSNGIRDQDLKEQLHLRKEKTSGRIFRKSIELEIAKQTVGTSIRLQKMSNWSLWRGQPPPKRKKRQHNRIRAMD
jgi:hypothetical protein